MRFAASDSRLIKFLVYLWESDEAILSKIVCTLRARYAQKARKNIDNAMEAFSLEFFRSEDKNLYVISPRAIFVAIFVTSFISLFTAIENAAKMPAIEGIPATISLEKPFDTMEVQSVYYPL